MGCEKKVIKVEIPLCTAKCVLEGLELLREFFRLLFSFHVFSVFVLTPLIFLIFVLASFVRNVLFLYVDLYVKCSQLASFLLKIDASVEHVLILLFFFL